LLFVYYLGYFRGYTLTIGIGISTLQKARRLVNPRQRESRAEIKKRRKNKEVASLISSLISMCYGSFLSPE
jgi:hypothetical protein